MPIKTKDNTCFSNNPINESIEIFFKKMKQSKPKDMLWYLPNKLPRTAWPQWYHQNLNSSNEPANDHPKNLSKMDTEKVLQCIFWLNFWHCFRECSTVALSIIKEDIPRWLCPTSWSWMKWWKLYRRPYLFLWEKNKVQITTILGYNKKELTNNKLWIVQRFLKATCKSKLPSPAVLPWHGMHCYGYFQRTW